MKMMKNILMPAVCCLALAMVGCKDDAPSISTHNPDTAEKVSVDRFSAAAGHLQVRTATNGLPGPNVAVNFDQDPFITKGLGPNGEHVEYYNFDVQAIAPAPIWVLFREGESSPVEGQLNIIDVLPGEANYNDFWQVIKVTVPANYVANEVASYDEITSRGYRTEPTTTLVNCPVVPAGSTASKRLVNETNQLIRGWYDEKVVYYFSFSEKELSLASGRIPTSPIIVAFNLNPTADPATGPASGFKTEAGSDQTHNVVATLPSQAGYSPLWNVSAYDQADFNLVTNYATASGAHRVANGLGLVNCPVVKIN